jgi:hypothetical protein
MATKIRVKPVLPTEIREKAMVAQVISEIHRRPSPEQIARMEERDASILRMIKR